MRSGSPGPDLARACGLPKGLRAEEQSRAGGAGHGGGPYDGEDHASGKGRKALRNCIHDEERSLSAEVCGLDPDQGAGPGRAGDQASYPGTSRAESHVERGLTAAFRRSHRTPVTMTSEAAPTPA